MKKHKLKDTVFIIRDSKILKGIITRVEDYEKLEFLPKGKTKASRRIEYQIHTGVGKDQDWITRSSDKVFTTREELIKSL